MSLKNENIIAIIKKPRITEKAGVKSESENVYTFEIENYASKVDVKNAIKVLYKMDPIKVNIVKLPSKNINTRGKVGRKSGVKKAIVFMKKQDKIAFI